ncbi:MAG: hypothetical protein ABSD78_19690 [Acidimicrobiales bacterium]|jgi:hypothetical protein
MADWTLTPIELLREKRLYPYPFGWGSGWPKEAPNYMAFRWGGHVQCVAHVEGYEVVDDMHDVLPEFPSEHRKDNPLMVLRLGPPIPMRHEPLPAGAGYRASRMWVQLDLLLTSQTLKDALAETKGRERIGAGEGESR